MSGFSVRVLDNIPVDFPAREVFLRLGGNIFKTGIDPQTRCRLEQIYRRGFALCALQGRYGVLDISGFQEDGIEYEGGFLRLGKSFTAQLEGAKQLWFGAVTAGNAIVDARDREADSAAQAILDAVGSESADAAMDAMHRMAAKELMVRGAVLSGRRFSPGYGDMKLELQNFFYENLNMAAMGVVINRNFFLTPEKSVTAFAAVNRLQTESITYEMR